MAPSERTLGVEHGQRVGLVKLEPDGQGLLVMVFNVRLAVREDAKRLRLHRSEFG